MDDFVRSDWFVQTQVSQIRDDFVRSHVCGCASAALDDIDDEVRLADDPPPWSQVDDDEIVGSEEVLIVQAKKTGAVFATAETNSSSSCIKYTSKSQRRVSFAISTTSNSEMICSTILSETVW